MRMNVLVHRYTRLVFRIASRLAGPADGARDVVQDVFLHAFADLDKLSELRPLRLVAVASEALVGRHGAGVGLEQARLSQRR